MNWKSYLVAMLLFSASFVILVLYFVYVPEAFASCANYSGLLIALAEALGEDSVGQ